MFQRNIPAFSQEYRVIAPDLRGHGQSGKGDAGHHVSRLAMDLKELIDHLKLPSGNIIGIGASLGCAVLWSFAELFTASEFSDMVFVDQAPLQNYATDGSWGAEHGSRGCNSDSSLANLRASLRLAPREVYRNTVESCLAYRSHPSYMDNETPMQRVEDEEFFVNIAEQSNSNFCGALMANHTSLDWRNSLSHIFSLSSCASTEILVIASTRSGCFPAKGPLAVVDLVSSGRKGRNTESRASGLIISWGGHWCYWEHPVKFNSLVISYLKGNDLDDYGQTYYS